MDGPLRRLPGRLLLATTALLLLAGLLGFAGWSRASAAPDWGRDSRGELCANAARITFRALENLDSTLNDLVEDGALTQEQADTVAASLTDDDSDGATGRCAGIAQSVRTTIESVSDLLGLEWSEIRDRRKSGESMAEIAESAGVSRDELIDALLSGVTERLDTAEAGGRITPEERAEREQTARARIEHLIDRHHDDVGTESEPDAGTPETDSP
jgi:hypothetical protein